MQLSANLLADSHHTGWGDSSGVSPVAFLGFLSALPARSLSSVFAIDGDQAHQSHWFLTT